MRMGPAIVLLGLGAVCCSFGGAQTQQSAQPEAYALIGDYGGTHDPSIAKEGGTYYVFATGRAPQGGQFAVRCSPDLHAWKLCGEIFPEIPAWIAQDDPGVKDLWAPDVSSYAGGWRLYYAYSVFGKNASGIALATNRTLDANNSEYKWVDQGLVLRSTAADDYNAIDPNFVEDGKGGDWLVFGSFWSGIKLRRLDAVTGRLSPTDTRMYSLAGRSRPTGAADAKPGLFPDHHSDSPPDVRTDTPPEWEAIEAPFIVRHDGYFYLFVSWDLCCRGVRSTYRTMVGRSRAVIGPYVDATGKAMLDGGGTELLTANERWLGPGGASVLMQRGGPDVLAFHAYDARTGRPALQISTITWTGGWPHVALGLK